MSDANRVSDLTALLNPNGSQRFFEFLDSVDTDTAARFRAWLNTAGDPELALIADLLNKARHGRDFVGWWRTHDKAVPTRSPASRPQQRTPTPVEHLHSQARARAANRDITVGSSWLLGGLLVTVMSYGLAVSSPNGGHYVIATGAILYGAVRLLRGLRF